jgi:hypothetical protein
MERVIEEVIEPRLHRNVFNMDIGFALNRTWYLVTNMIEKYTDVTIQAKGKQVLDSAHYSPLARVQIECKPLADIYVGCPGHSFILSSLKFSVLLLSCEAKARVSF